MSEDIGRSLPSRRLYDHCERLGGFGAKIEKRKARAKSQHFSGIAVTIIKCIQWPLSLRKEDTELPVDQR